jgi:hypothetical protein
MSKIIQMQLFKTIGAIFFLFLLNDFMVEAQPIPIELMMGHKYGTVNLSFSKDFTQKCRLGFFHMNTVQFDYKDKNNNSFILQDQIYIETFKNLRIAGGVVYSNGGFNPTAGLQYVYGGKKLFFLCAPRINIESDPSYDIMTILQYIPDIFGERMINKGIKSKQLRYSAVCIHLDHSRSYKSESSIKKNIEMRRVTRRERKIRTEFGIIKLHESPVEVKA